MEIRLEKIDPEQNCFRYYLIRRDRDLFAGEILVAHWGRIGSVGRMGMRASGSPEVIRMAWDRLVQRKLRRGYAIAGAGIMSDGAAP
ncbi:WGR domain-containing protein [Rhodobacter sp. NSM]|uniref:WGR domain-containing protein n=1 Tax=Rhodobacter sp. NSM TaxID=3457501 RepID=UPI003FD53FB4